jgi:hypothetical protein
MPDLLRYCIKVAELEVSGLADFRVKIEPIRTGGSVRGLVTGFQVAWCKKDIPGLKDAYSELKRSKVGRLARLTGKVEEVSPLGQLTPGDELGAMVEALRVKRRKRVPAP